MGAGVNLRLMLGDFKPRFRHIEHLPLLDAGIIAAVSFARQWAQVAAACLSMIPASPR